MTFAEARRVLRRDVLAEASEDFYSEEDLHELLARSAKELALTFGFPTALGSAALVQGDAEFSLPGDAANVDLDEVTFRGYALSLAPYRIVTGMADDVSIGVPRFYNFEPKRGGVVLIAPRAHEAGDVVFEYVQRYEPPDFDEEDTTTEVWGGLFPAYHDLVVYRAGVKAFDASLEYEKSGYWAQREQAMAQEFTAFLNKTPANRLIGQEVAES